MKEEGLAPEEQLTLEPYENDHAMVIGTYRAAEQWMKIINIIFSYYLNMLIKLLV